MEDAIATCKRRAEQAMERFLRVLSFVPAEKLDWRPSPTAKSALQIAAHAAGYGGGFARLIREGKFPPVEEFLGPIKEKIESIGTLEQAEAVLRRGIVETLAALDTVSTEQIGAVIDTP